MNLWMPVLHLLVFNLKFRELCSEADLRNEFATWFTIERSHEFQKSMFQLTTHSFVCALFRSISLCDETQFERVCEKHTFGSTDL